MGDIMMRVGDIMSTVKGVQYRRGKIFCYLSTPRYWAPPTVLMISPHMCHDIPHGTQISKDGILHGTEQPPRYSWYPPHASWYPHCTEHPHGTQDNPPMVLMISPQYWPPHGTQDIPHIYHEPPTVLNTPTVLKISPTVLMISSHGTEHPHGIEHLPRYCTHIIQGVNLFFASFFVDWAKKTTLKS